MAVLLQDDFTGTTIDTSKWNETDPNSIISQNNILTILNTTVTVGRFVNMLKSVSTVTAGVATIQADFNYDATDTSGGFGGVTLYIDANNYIEMAGRGDEAKTIKLNVISGGSVVYSSYSVGVLVPQSVKITYNITTHDIKFWYWNSTVWTQLRTTQNYNLGSTVYAVLTAGTNTTFSGTKLTFDNAYYSDTDYTTQYPVTTNIKSINGLSYASVKSYNGLAKASIKNINGLA